MVKRLPSRLATGNARLLEGTVGGAAKPLNTVTKSRRDKIKFFFILCFYGYTLSPVWAGAKLLVFIFYEKGRRDELGERWGELRR